VAKTTGKLPDTLKNQQKVPEGMEYVFIWYLELQSGERLTYSEILAWSTLTRKNIMAWETEAIISLDRIFWIVINDGYS
jgi:hypothetical protein